MSHHFGRRAVHTHSRIHAAPEELPDRNLRSIHNNFCRLIPLHTLHAHIHHNLILTVHGTHLRQVAGMSIYLQMNTVRIADTPKSEITPQLRFELREEVLSSACSGDDPVLFDSCIPNESPRIFLLRQYPLSQT